MLVAGQINLRRHVRLNDDTSNIGGRYASVSPVCRVAQHALAGGATTHLLSLPGLRLDLRCS